MRSSSRLLELRQRKETCRRAKAWACELPLLFVLFFFLSPFVGKAGSRATRGKSGVKYMTLEIASAYQPDDIDKRELSECGLGCKYMKSRHWCQTQGTNQRRRIQDFLQEQYHDKAQP